MKHALLLGLLLHTCYTCAQAPDDLPTLTLEQVGAGPALLIGVAEYDRPNNDTSFGDLPGVTADLPRMKSTLLKLGYRESDITVLLDPDLASMKQAMDAFGLAAEQSSKASFFYYSGHGVLHNGRNYLIPKQAPIQTKGHLELYAIPAEHVTSYITGKPSAGPCLFFLDACRNNNLRDSTKSGEEDLTLKRRAGMFIGYATTEGKTSSMLASGSYFTTALATRLLTPGRSLDDVFSGVIADVEKQTASLGNDFQPPEKLSKLRYVFHLVPGGAVGPSPPAEDPALRASRERPFNNSLGQEFIPVPGTKGLLMCRTELRVRDFRAYARATDYVQKGGAFVMKVKTDKDGNPTGTTWELNASASWEKPGFPQSEEHPVVCISLEEAEAFCTWLSQQEPAHRYRLPTDAEWSAAVGLGKYPWGSGDTPPEGSGNYAGTEWKASMPKANWPTAYERDDGYPRTAPVASFAESKHGFYDLGGNVWEWCSDNYQASMNDAAALEAVPALKEEKSIEGTPYRVLRGASWRNSASVNLRTSYRSFAHPTARNDNFGVRVVLVVSGG